MAANSETHPLGNCMTLMEVNDFMLINPSADGKTAVLSWVSYSTKDNKFLPKDSLNFPDYTDIIFSKPVSIPIKDGNVQGIILVKKNTIEFISAKDDKMTSQSFAADTAEIKAIIGTHPQTGRIIFACNNESSHYFLTLDIHAGSGDMKKQVLTGVIGNLLKGDMAGAGLDTFLMLLVNASDSLVIYSINSADVVHEETPCNATTHSPIGPYSDKFDIHTVIAQLEEAPWHHFVCTYTDIFGRGYIAAAHLDKENKLQVIAQQLDTSFAKPIRFNFRLAAGTLWNQKGTEAKKETSVVPLVVGYCGEYGKVDGCACLLLYELDAADPKRLIQTSRYAVDTDDESSFASNDLLIGAGLFSITGEMVLGVLVAGVGTSLGQLAQGKSSVKIVMVDLDQNHRIFPPLAANPTELPVHAVIDMKAEIPISGFQCDLSGQSVRLGFPRYEQREGRSQIMAILQAPPFERSLFEKNFPTLTFTSHNEVSQNINVNTNKSWQQSKDLGFHISIGPFTFGTTLNTMYGEGFDKMEDTAASTSITVTNQFSEQDHMIVLSFDYHVWIYPTLRDGKKIGEILVIFPTTSDPKQAILECSNPAYGYQQKHEAGTLLSYIDSSEIGDNPFPAEKSKRLTDLGYSPDTLLFSLYSQSIDPTSSSTWNFSKNKMTSNATTKSWNLHQSANFSGAFNFAEEIFDLLPSSFGLNAGVTNSYNDSETKTTTVSYSEMIDIMISYPSINSEQYAFEVTPIIYQHKDMGCLMVTYQVGLIGNSWKQFNSNSPLKLMAVTPRGSEDESDSLNSFYTHSINFHQKEDKTEITVEVFNNSIQTIEDVAVEIFTGAQTPLYEVMDDSKERFYGGWYFPFPENDKNKGSKPLDTQIISTINPIGREKVMFTQPLKDKDYVCVFVYSKKWSQQEMSMAKGYWRQFYLPQWQQ